MSAQVVQVIRTEFCFGLGTTTDPCRLVTQWWTFEGELIATRDPLDQPVGELNCAVVSETR